MPENSNSSIVVKTNIGVKELYEFTIFNNYKSIRGVVSVAFSIMSAVGAVVFWNDLKTWQRIAILLFALMFTVIEPIEYYIRCNKQVKKSFQKPIIYVFGDKGIEVSQGEEKAHSEWTDLMKVVTTKNNIVVYLSPVRAFILPKKNIGDKFEILKKMMEDNTSCYKFKMIK